MRSDADRIEKAMPELAAHDHADDDGRDERDERRRTRRPAGDAVEGLGQVALGLGPGRMPGMNPPCLRIWSACLRIGSKAIAV
jgi:hypothetical protein